MPAPVLIVEDDDAIRETLRLLLAEEEGYLVYEAPDGRPALDRLRGATEGMVVLLDLQMPGMDGLAVLHALAAEPSLLSRHVIVVMSAYSGPTLPLAVAQLLARQRIPMLAKPFDIDHVVVAVRQAQARLSDESPSAETP